MLFGACAASCCEASEQAYELDWSHRRCGALMQIFFHGPYRIVYATAPTSVHAGAHSG